MEKLIFELNTLNNTDDNVEIDQFYKRENLEIPKIPERELVKHFLKLSEMNFSVDKGFYPLGSCTMKYNPKFSEYVSQWDEFKFAHPLYPEICQGIMRIMWEMEGFLCEICGMDAFSLHPSAGAHGEFLALSIAKRYFSDKSEKRTKVLLPDSSHGTNPASASMCGFSVEEVKSDERGNVHLQDLKGKIDKNTAVLMLTYPNTLGLCDEKINEVVKIVKSEGALLYLDGANMNALLGIVKPGDLGFDFVHLNLHKTFSAPHGGGGPGSGPLGVKNFLKKYLPNPRIKKDNDKFTFEFSKESVGKIESFFGNFSVILKAYIYIRMLGGEGLKKVAEIAVLNANYMRVKLSKRFNIPFNRICKHEFVISEKGFPNDVKTEDFAKRLQDFGFHPPTVYFPLIVKGAMMIEPTETETKETLDSFLEAMNKILDEAEKEPQKLKSAPHKSYVRRVDVAKASKEPKVKR